MSSTGVELKGLAAADMGIWRTVALRLRTKPLSADEGGTEKRRRSAVERLNATSQTAENGIKLGRQHHHRPQANKSMR